MDGGCGRGSVVLALTNLKRKGANDVVHRHQTSRQRISITLAQLFETWRTLAHESSLCFSIAAWSACCIEFYVVFSLVNIA